MRTLTAAAICCLLVGGGLLHPPASRGQELLTNKTVGAARDSLWHEGHDYRQWIYDQNFIGDENSNLDPEISFLADGRVRSHPSQVYFYNDIEAAQRKGEASGLPVAFYVFDHTCADCLFILPQLYRRPAVVEASKDFVNCYVELPLYQREATAHGLMASSLTVQFFTPGGRRLRVASKLDEAKLLKNYAEIKAHLERKAKEAREAKGEGAPASREGGR